MEIVKCHNKNCGRPYEIREIGISGPGGKESEGISCPHCNDTYTRRSSGMFTTSAMTPEREADYNKANK